MSISISLKTLKQIFSNSFTGSSIQLCMWMYISIKYIQNYLKNVTQTDLIQQLITLAFFVSIYSIFKIVNNKLWKKYYRYCFASKKCNRQFICFKTGIFFSQIYFKYWLCAITFACTFLKVTSWGRREEKNWKSILNNNTINILNYHPNWILLIEFISNFFWESSPHSYIKAKQT